MTKIIYYVTSSGENHVKTFIESLNPTQQRKITRILSHIEEYGLTTAIRHVRKLNGTPLWEIRVLGQDNIRVFYACIVSNTIILLNGFIKKSQQTPSREIQNALHRLKDWQETENA